jgi:hypothetical protein
LSNHWIADLSFSEKRTVADSAGLLGSRWLVGVDLLQNVVYHTSTVSDMALSAQSQLRAGGCFRQSSRRALARPVRAAVDYQSPSTRTGANELQALARMSNVVSVGGALVLLIEREMQVQQAVYGLLAAGRS